MFKFAWREENDGSANREQQEGYSHHVNNTDDDVSLRRCQVDVSPLTANL